MLNLGCGVLCWRCGPDDGLGCRWISRRAELAGLGLRASFWGGQLTGWSSSLLGHLASDVRGRAGRRRAWVRILGRSGGSWSGMRAWMAGELGHGLPWKRARIKAGLASCFKNITFFFITFLLLLLSFISQLSTS